MDSRYDLPENVQIVNGELTYLHQFGLTQNGDRFFDDTSRELTSYDLTDGKIVILTIDKLEPGKPIEFILIKDGGEEIKTTRTFNKSEFDEFCRLLINGPASVDSFIAEN